LETPTERAENRYPWPLDFSSNRKTHMSTATQAEKDKFENGRPWRWLSKTVIAANPICQAIEPETGEQCHNPASIVHHLIAPEDCWELRATVSNLCAVCPKHHAGGARGDNLKLDYKPTREPGVMGAPDIYHAHASLDRRKITATTLSAHEWEAHARKAESATAEWLAWKARQVPTTALEQPKTQSTEHPIATDTQQTT
jgi:hypothetical protein